MYHTPGIEFIDLKFTLINMTLINMKIQIYDEFFLSLQAILLPVFLTFYYWLKVILHIWVSCKVLLVSLALLISLFRKTSIHVIIILSKLLLFPMMKRKGNFQLLKYSYLCVEL